MTGINTTGSNITQIKWNSFN